MGHSVTIVFQKNARLLAAHFETTDDMPSQTRTNAPRDDLTTVNFFTNGS
jgi:hypothetical protein